MARLAGADDGRPSPPHAHAVIALVLCAAFMHLFAYWMVKGYADANIGADTAALVGITGTLVLSWSLLLSQAMESVTRAFYSRSDLDLILTSPVFSRKVFAVRMARIAVGAVLVAVPLAAPFINVLALRGGSRWLASYGVVAGMGAIVTAVALTFTIVALFSGRFGEHAVAAAGVSQGIVRQRRWSAGFRHRSPARVLRQKEWTLLARDPWLVSQTLMQILYLLPPALLLWLTFRDAAASYVVLIPVVVMAMGQLAGGLTWLSISGEDAPNLIASAPILAPSVLRAKIEAVLGMIALLGGTLMRCWRSKHRLPRW